MTNEDILKELESLLNQIAVLREHSTETIIVAPYVDCAANYLNALHDELSK